MTNFKKVFNFKIISIAISVVFLFNTALYSLPVTEDYLRMPIGEEIYERMHELYNAHEINIDAFIQRCIGEKKNKSLLELEKLNKEFIDGIDKSVANETLVELNKILFETGGMIQVIFVDKEEGLPEFEGQKVWGHAGTYITVFAMTDEDKTEEGRKRIIARIFHEIRARSTRARKLFEEGMAPPYTLERLEALRKEFETLSMRILQEVEEKGFVTGDLAREFANLKFNKEVAIENRDYTLLRWVPRVLTVLLLSALPVFTGDVAGIQALDLAVAAVQNRDATREASNFAAGNNGEAVEKMLPAGKVHIIEFSDHNQSQPNVLQLNLQPLWTINTGGAPLLGSPTGIKIGDEYFTLVLSQRRELVIVNSKGEIVSKGGEDISFNVSGDQVTPIINLGDGRGDLILTRLTDSSTFIGAGAFSPTAPVPTLVYSTTWSVVWPGPGLPPSIVSSVLRPIVVPLDGGTKKGVFSVLSDSGKTAGVGVDILTQEGGFQNVLTNPQLPEALFINGAALLGDQADIAVSGMISNTHAAGIWIIDPSTGQVKDQFATVNPGDSLAMSGIPGTTNSVNVIVLSIDEIGTPITAKIKQEASDRLYNIMKISVSYDNKIWYLHVLCETDFDTHSVVRSTVLLVLDPKYQHFLNNNSLPAAGYLLYGEDVPAIVAVENDVVAQTGIVAVVGKNTTDYYTLPEQLTENTNPLLVDVNGDGLLEIVVLTSKRVVIIDPRTKQTIFMSDPITGRFDKSPLVYKTPDGKILLVAETETGKLMAWELSATEIISGSWSMAGHDTEGTSRFPGGTPLPDLKRQFLPLLAKGMPGAQEVAVDQQAVATGPSVEQNIIAWDIGVEEFKVYINDTIFNTYNSEDMEIFLSNARIFLLKFLAVAGSGLQEKGIDTIEFDLFPEGAEKVDMELNIVKLDAELVFNDSDESMIDLIAQLKKLGIYSPLAVIFMIDYNFQSALQTSL